MPKSSYRNGKASSSGLRLFGRHVSGAALRRFTVLAITTLVIFLLLLWRLGPQPVSLTMGEVATQMIIANRPAYYIDTEETQRQREQARSAVPASYNRDPNQIAIAERTVVDIFTAAARVRFDESLPSDLDRVDRLRNELDLELSPATLRLLVEMQEGPFERIKQSTVDIVRKLMATQIRQNTDDLAKAREAARTAANQLAVTDQFRALVAEVTQAALRHNMIYDPGATEQAREAAAEAVAEVSRQLRPGDIIIAPEQEVTRRHLDMFEALGLTKPKTDYAQAMALLLLVIAVVGVVSIYILQFAPEALAHERRYYTLCMTVVLVVMLVRLLEGSPYYAIYALTSVSAMAIFLSALLSPQVAVGAVLLVSILIGAAGTGGDARLLIVTAIAGLGAAYALPSGRTKTTMVTRAALLTALLNPALLGVTSVVLGIGINYRLLGMAGVAGLAATVIGMGAVMLIQRPLRLITEMRLIELLNPNEPLMRRMLTEAPGSYQSCVMVANLAEPAAEGIGANALLTRCQCMYHDIGKLKRPGFFAENQFGSDNPHEHLSPHLSALVLISHVKEGMEMAEEAKLPKEVAAVIPEHHGTTLVSYLYRKAVQDAEDPSDVRETDFRYDGPIPQSRETAVVMLADTVEAAARTMEDHAPSRIEDLVNRLIEAKIEDGQLDDAPLTFKDIASIKRSFINTLTRMFHQRTRYPDRYLPENVRGLTGPAPRQEPSGEGGKNGSGSARKEPATRGR